MKWWASFFLLAVLAALAFRLPELDRRPMHNDEGVNALKFGRLWSGGGYRYDPNEHHGPTLHYFTAAWCAVTGAPAFRDLSEVRLRQVTAIAGALLVAAVFFWRKPLGPVPSLAAAWLVALSPAMVFYSRYWIHEMLLVLFTFLALVGAWRLAVNPSWFAALGAGLAAGLMAATKETFVLNVAAAGAGVAAVWLARPEAPRAFLSGLSWRHWLAAAGVALGTAGLFFTSFGANPAGLLDAIRTYEPWVRRAAGDSPHVNPWWFFLERLAWFQRGNGPVWSELLILVLGLVGAAAAVRPAWCRAADARMVRFLLGYTLALTLIYSAIPYKTPWCVLGFLHGWILLAGVGAGVLWQAARSVRARAGVVLLLLCGAAHLGWQAQQANWRHYASRENPWVFAHTSPDLLELVDLVKQVIQAGDGPRTLIHVVARGGDYWPLPWYLRACERVGWWDESAAAPGIERAPVVITSAGLEPPGLDEATHIHAGYFQLRPRVFLELHVERGLWERHLKP